MARRCVQECPGSIRATHGDEVCAAGFSREPETVMVRPANRPATRMKGAMGRGARIGAEHPRATDGDEVCAEEGEEGCRAHGVIDWREGGAWAVPSMMLQYDRIQEV